MSHLARSSLLLVALVAVAGSSGAAAAAPTFGDGAVLAPIPAAARYCAGQAGCNGGYPEGVAVVGDRVYVAGPATFGTAGKGPSVVTVLNRASGDLITEIPIAGEQLAFEHALSGIAVDAAGDVFVVSTQLGVIRLHRHGRRYQQSSYAPPLPDLPACTPGGPAPCTPTFVDLPPLSNEMTFDAAGNLYVTDSLQATIFRVPAGGGSIAPWFASPLLAGNLAAPLPFGANGIKLSPDRAYLYLVETFDPVDPSLGHVYRVPLVDAPAPDSIEHVATFGGGVVPDSLTFGASGTIYVTLAGASQIAVLEPDGTERTRITGPAGSPIPFDNPATMAFDDGRRSLLVTNHAIFGDPAHFAVLRVFVGERGDPRPGDDDDGDDD
ncbi:MAG: SMP-30/gluconolactonase/LRE family protein [Myxococcales bacterium]|nr:SMP-30/gluconolactonase/LRE family protein [Myxococcales bacterium]MBK7198277.1 SMP-30/gluconolactonase/LRE family protein [Myxococcales bacterium]MBP6848741.1 SMP-30/gluconolactonase/LRE family protein [Kofleriaceae bacterium]